MMLFLLIFIALSSLVLLSIQSVIETSHSYQQLKDIQSSFSYFKLENEYIFYYRVFNLTSFTNVKEEQVLAFMQKESCNRVKDIMVAIVMNQKEATKQQEALAQLSFLGTSRGNNRSWVPAGIYSKIENKLIKMELKNQHITKPVVFARILYTGLETKKELTKDFHFSIDELAHILTK